jgi:hypothetical protein
VLEVEPFHQLVFRKDLLVAMRPAQACQVVHQRFGQVALVAVLRDAHRAMALRQPLAVGAEDHGYMRKMGKLFL